MKANELRIGNLIYSRNGSVSVVDVINDTTRKVEFDDSDDDYDLSECNPILLTEEILLRCGFKRGQSFYYEYKLKPVISYDLFDDGSYNIEHMNSSICNIKYLHQLQNIYFALTGTELEINL